MGLLEDRPTENPDPQEHQPRHLPGITTLVLPIAMVLTTRAVASNMHRRHLTTAQRAAVAAELATMENGENQHHRKNEGGQNCPPSISLEQAADLMGVSRRSVVSAKKRMKDDPVTHEAGESRL
jgi:hypothetical protein